ncbi:unnamed protein product, partial [Brenthis ino]
MFKILPVLVLAALAVDTFGQRIIHPTYRPPPRKPIIIRTVRDTGDQEPLWLNQGEIPKAPSSADHPVLPTYIDDVKLDPNRRYVRSVDSPSARRSGGSHSSSRGNHDTGATHPGYNRRNARDTGNQEPLWLNQGDIPKAPSSADHPVLPTYIDDVRLDPNRRYARNIGSSRSSFLPRPSLPRPTGPNNPFPRPAPPRRTFPIYANH